MLNLCQQIPDAVPRPNFLFYLALDSPSVQKFALHPQLNALESPEEQAAWPDVPPRLDTILILAYGSYHTIPRLSL